MAGGANPNPYIVVYDPDALIDFEDVKSKGERKAMFNAVDKLRKLGPRLAPPHVKALKGEDELFELRPRQGQSPTRPLYRRFDDLYVILAVATKTTFDARVKDAQERAKQYGN